MVTWPLATYQLPVVLPSQPRSMYETGFCAARAAVGSIVRHRARTQNRMNIRFFVEFLLYIPTGILTRVQVVPSFVAGAYLGNLFPKNTKVFSAEQRPTHPFALSDRAACGMILLSAAGHRSPCSREGTEWFF